MIRFEGVTAAYELPSGDRHPVFENLSLSIQDGEFVAVMGRNGSGKTTLARLCNGLLLPAAGRVVVDGYAVTATDHRWLREIRRRVGMVFQNPDNQLVSVSVEREIAFGLENLAIAPEEMRARVEAALVEFDLERYRKRSPALLSGGEKQRLALAAVLAMQPGHLVLDEPTAMLDSLHKKNFLQRLSQLHHKPDKVAPTILLVTHDPVEALFADRLLILHQGRIHLDGSPREVFLQTNRLAEAGVRPPLEFSVYTYLREHKFPLTSVDEVLLSPIL